MAEAVSVKIVSQMLGAMFSRCSEAYKEGKSIVEARKALDKLRETIQTLQARLTDAEQNQPESASMKNWIKRLKGVMYDAEDLFDKINTDDMVKQQSKVWVPSFKFNPIVSVISNFSIASNVKDIRKRLLEISKDMSDFPREGALLPLGGMISREEDEFDAGLLDSNDVLGREEDKKSIFKMIFNESTVEPVPVIAIVGIGGMGKTTLAKLILNDPEIVQNFDKRWFACISNTCDDKELIGRIFESISGKSYRGFNVKKLSMKIRELIANKKFLLVLDGVWEGDSRRLQSQRRLLSLGAKGSKIIVTTRSLSVPREMKVERAERHQLRGLSADKSWDLFKKFAFDQNQERDPKWIELGKKVVKKCANVPLAIKCIGSHLRLKDSIPEWESFIKGELSKLRTMGQLNVVMSVLKLSYDQLDSTLKQCFAYCSLFPKNSIILKQELIYLWIAQGYINPNNANQTVEEIGHSVFMDLLRRSLFQEETRDLSTRDVLTCTMHDLIHDLAQLVADDESIVLTTSSSRIECTRHVSVGYSIDGSWAIPAAELKVKWLRSFLFMGGGSVCKPALVQEFAKYKFLRALSLKKLPIEKVSGSIGELKQLRYLDLSETTLTNLPESITKLLNLQKLDIHECKQLEILPTDFRKLVNLRHLDIRGCDNLKHMPPRFGELSSLQQLDEFKVGSGGQRSKLEALIELKLKGKLTIRFEDDTDDWSGVECWQLSLTLQQLNIVGYRGERIPKWAVVGDVNLTHLSLFGCSKVKCLPTLRHLPKLKYLYLRNMEKLDYIEGEANIEGSFTACPHLKNILLIDLPNLKAWSSGGDAVATSTDVSLIEEGTHSSSTGAPPQLLMFSSLLTLHVDGCPELNSMALFPKLRALSLKSVNARVISQLLSVHDSPSSSSLSLSSLRHVSIESCDGLMCFPGKSLTSLQYLFMRHCNELKYLELAPVDHNILEDLYLCCYPKLELWKQKKRGVDWDSLPKLRQLRLDEVPSSERLPDCLQRRRAHGELKIEAWATSR